MSLCTRVKAFGFWLSLSAGMHAGIDPKTSFAQLQHSLQEASGIAAPRQHILIGFPPKLIQVRNSGPAKVERGVW